MRISNIDAIKNNEYTHIIPRKKLRTAIYRF